MESLAQVIGYGFRCDNRVLEMGVHGCTCSNSSLPCIGRAMGHPCGLPLVWRTGQSLVMILARSECSVGSQVRLGWPVLDKPTCFWVWLRASRASGSTSFLLYPVPEGLPGSAAAGRGPRCFLHHPLGSGWSWGNNGFSHAGAEADIPSRHHWVAESMVGVGAGTCTSGFCAAQ